MAQDTPNPVQPHIVVNATNGMLGHLRPSFFSQVPAPRPIRLVRGHPSPSTGTWGDYSDYSADQRRYSETRSGLETLRSSASYSPTGPALLSQRVSIDDLLSPRTTSTVLSERRGSPSRGYHPCLRQAYPSHQPLLASSVSPAEQHRSIYRPPVEQYRSHHPRSQRHWQGHDISPPLQYSPACSAPSQLHRDAATCQHSPLPSHQSTVSEPLPTGSSASTDTSASPLVSSPPPNLRYSLIVRQQPIAARACGFGERDRRVVDPPPILQLKITNDKTGAPEQDPNALLAIHCRLISVESSTPENEAESSRTYFNSQRLMGTSVASPYQAKDEYGVAGTFFVFPDLSCRMPGKYKLQFILIRVDPMMMVPGAKHGTVAAVDTDVFSVYAAKDFPGMQYSSALLRALRSQGLNVSLKRGTEARMVKGKKRKWSMSSENGDGRERGDGGRAYSY